MHSYFIHGYHFSHAEMQAREEIENPTVIVMRALEIKFYFFYSTYDSYSTLSKI